MTDTLNNKKKYNHTLLMPKTDFSMRAGLVNKEPLYHQKWADLDLYQKLLTKNKDNESFLLHDGPPYANGNLHVGHALNKILKDIILRYKTMQGFYSPMVVGWDTHGLPIEHKMLSEKKVNHKELEKSMLRDMCKKYALSQVEIQLAQFRKMNLLSDLKDRYITLDKRYEAKQIEVFAKMVEKKLVYRDLKPIYWSPSSQSALAEAEIEYRIHTSPSVYVACQIITGNDVISNDTELVIWTTTPWTLIANGAIAVGNKISYSLIALESGRKLVVASELLETVSKMIGWENLKVIKTFFGKDIVGITYKQPVDERPKPVVSGHHVTVESGTGLVHIAPAFGEDDFRIGKENKLEMIVHVEDDGTLNDHAKGLVGMFYENANKEIGMKLDKENKLLKLKFIKHQYPHDWRTKKPVMFRATLQWFVSIEPIKAGIVDQINKVKWTPSWGQSRLTKMITDRNDWCISRQRSWGLPIPIFYDKNKKPIFDQEIFTHIANLFRAHGSNIWFQKTADELLPHKYQKQGLIKETDIMDVWFDSGVSHYAIRGLYENLPAKIDLYLEGNDQYRGWYNSSIITGYVMNEKSPYAEVFAHGFVLDEKGNKMSKSLGNVIDPLKVIKTLGADILRLWVASADSINDVHIGQNILKQTSENYRKMRNTLRFLLGNLNDFDKTTDTQTELTSVDQFVLLKWNQLKNEVLNHFNNYKIHLVIKDLLNFMTDILSSFYFDFAKDILYINKAKSKRRLQLQTVMSQITTDLLKIIAPILPVTSEEAYEHLNLTNKEFSIHATNFFTNSVAKDEVLENKWNDFIELRSLIFKELENARNEKVIGKSLEAKLTLELPKKYQVFANDNLAQLLIVSQLEVKYLDIETAKINVAKASGLKCMRCWHINLEANMFDTELCQKCHLVIN